MKKNIVPILLFIMLLHSCDERRQTPIYANNDEVVIIDKMKCWESVSAEHLIAYITFSSSKSRDKNKNWDKWHRLKDEAQLKGRESLYNDTLFIDIIRNDSILKHMLAQRKILSKKIKGYTGKIPFFKKEINKILEEIVEYKYNSGDEWGLFLFDPTTFLSGSKFYRNYSEYLKDKYSLLENANVKESYIVEFNELLKEIEVLDRKLWMLEHFESARIEVVKEIAKQKRKQNVDSIFNN